MASNEEREGDAQAAPKAAYVPPVLVRLGLLRKLTRYTF